MESFLSRLLVVNCTDLATTYDILEEIDSKLKVYDPTTSLCVYEGDFRSVKKSKMEYEHA